MSIQTSWKHKFFLAETAEPSCWNPQFAGAYHSLFLHWHHAWRDYSSHAIIIDPYIPAVQTSVAEGTGHRACFIPHRRYRAHNVADRIGYSNPSPIQWTLPMADALPPVSAKRRRFPRWLPSLHLPAAVQRQENNQRRESIEQAGDSIWDLFRCHPNFKFFHSLSITSIFSHLHGVLNVGKKITNYTV